MIYLSKASNHFINIVLSKIKIKQSVSYKQTFEYFERYPFFFQGTIKQTKRKPPTLQVNNPYISPLIKTHIFKLPNYQYVTFSVNNSTIRLHIFYENSIDDFLKIVTNYIYFMYQLSDFRKQTTFYYYLTDCKKIAKHKILTPDEVNTGSTNMNTGVITIWRKQEVYKTTIHELIHRMGLDGFHVDMLDFYKQRYGITSNNLLVNEAVTDFWAILINVYLTVKLLNLSYRDFLTYIQAERMFVLYQAQKMLSLNRDWNRYTHVFSYYIIKGELFQNLPLTLKKMNYQIDNYDNVQSLLEKTKPIQSKPFLESCLRMSKIELH